MTENTTGEVRTVSETGGEKGVKPRAFHLLPWKALGVIAEHFGKGARKYAAHNWRAGYEWSKSFSALQRHLADWWEGEERDEDGHHNLAAAGFHVLVLITYAVVDRSRYAMFDDRYKADPPVEPEPARDPEPPTLRPGDWVKVVQEDGTIRDGVVAGHGDRAKESAAHGND